jgi:hypothetical protein
MILGNYILMDAMGGENNILLMTGAKFVLPTDGNINSNSLTLSESVAVVGEKEDILVLLYGNLSTVSISKFNKGQFEVCPGHVKLRLSRLITTSEYCLFSHISHLPITFRHVTGYDLFPF